ncbi:hypothetical protein R7127_00510 [Vibrio sp. 1159]|uniref:hypothetical protein n=1 Tax=unclassified Vibrio TaxID=2614977 RepID=UPI0004225582|nr:MULTISPECIES: hypothetical protein [Vibrio]MDW2318763.1 hypothetical protein [Vibrio sp. 1159]MDW2402480.1 hypothetical protein [Vibrio sp. 1262-1]HCG6982509.1 hypothetical protein [Vibrio parahaemolyticus]HCG7365735.1 hypothetical protein [Vibrio parahaemolyticus]
MRVSPARRRRWNNILILGVIAFIVILNAPMWIKTYLLSEEVDPYPNLLRSDHYVRAIYYSGWELELKNGEWQANIKVSIPSEELVARWQSLEGTELTEQQYETLKHQLKAPESIEVWYQDLDEPQRITFYRLSDFWLFKNWQDKWIAISVDDGYLLPK